MKTVIQVLFVAVVTCVMLSTAWGADINGTWKGPMDMMGQSMELGFTFEADGTKLTGTHVGPQGNEYPISEGKIKGDDISFVVNVTGQMEMRIDFKGKIIGEEIKLTMEMDMGGAPGGGGPGGGMGGPSEVILKRVE